MPHAHSLGIDLLPTAQSNSFIFKSGAKQNLFSRRPLRLSVCAWQVANFLSKVRYRTNHFICCCCSCAHGARKQWMLSPSSNCLYIIDMCAYQLYTYPSHPTSICRCARFCCTTWCQPQVSLCISYRLLLDKAKFLASIFRVFVVFLFTREKYHHIVYTWNFCKHQH